MKIEANTIEAVKKISPSEMETHGYLTLAGNGKSYVCPNCGNGTGKDGTGITAKEKSDGWVYGCPKCKVGFDNIALIARYHNLDSKNQFRAVMERACQDFGLTSEAIEEKISSFQLQKSKPTDDAEIQAKIQELVKLDIERARANLENLPIEERRGISLDIYKFYGAGYVEDWQPPNRRAENKTTPATRRIILPNSAGNGYIAVMLPSDRTAANETYWKQQGGNKGVFGLNTVNAKECYCLFITEGEIDALSIYQAFKKNVSAIVNVVATSGATSSDSVVDEIAAVFEIAGVKKTYVYILFDEDSAGKMHAPLLRQKLLKRGFLAVYGFFENICADKTDANAILQQYGEEQLFYKVYAIAEQFNKELAQMKAEATEEENSLSVANDTTSNAPEAPTSPIEPPIDVNPSEPIQNGAMGITAQMSGIVVAEDCSFGEYLKSGLFDAEAERLRKYANRKSGFKNLDEVLTLAPGLYLIGAIPGAGKTTFCYQLLEQLAERGERCIYLSAEMTRQEMYSKTLARRLFLRDRHTSLKSFDIRRGGTSQTLQSIIEQLKEENLDLRVKEIGSENIDAIIAYLRNYITTSDRAPIICIDFLQLIRPAVPKHADNLKLAMDEVAFKLKNFQKATDATIIAISSFNRDNYTTSAWYKSFKESGGIEYTADALMALEFNEIAEIETGEAFKKSPREMKLKILKNRNGNVDEVHFNYYSAHDYFEATEKFDSAPEEKVKKVIDAD